MSHPSDEERLLARYIDCQEVMARAAKAAGFDGQEVSAAALLYYAACLVKFETPIGQGLNAVTAAVDFIRMNTRISVVDIDSISLN